MPKPNIFISHRWDYNDDYHSLVGKFDRYGFAHLNYSVPDHDPLDATRVRAIKAGLREQIRQCNFFIITARMACNTRWCKFEVDVAQEYGKPILSFRPFRYEGNVPTFIQDADNQDGPILYNTPLMIRKICAELNWQVPQGL